MHGNADAKLDADADAEPKRDSQHDLHRITVVISDSSCFANLLADPVPEPHTEPESTGHSECVPVAKSIGK
jgi:hypothetical protein